MADPLDRAVVLECARATERVPELLGIGPHLPSDGGPPEALTASCQPGVRNVPEALLRHAVLRLDASRP